MQKKLTALLLTLCMLLSCIILLSAFAESEDGQEYTASGDVIAEDVSEEVAETSAEPTDAITQEEILSEDTKAIEELQIEEESVQNADNTSKLKELAEYLSGIMSAEEMNEILTDYLYLGEVYGYTDEELCYIADLIVTGYDAADVMEAAYFLTDACESVETISQICDLKSEYNDDKYWIEDAYNKVTNYVHGELDVDEVREYLAAGITAEQIKSANVMSRKGIFTIKEILDSLVNGSSIVDIYNETNNTTVSEPINLLGLNDDAVENTYDLTEAVEFAALKGTTIEEAAAEIISSDDPQSTVAGYKDEKYAELTERLVKSGIVPGWIDDDLGVQFGE